MRLIPKHGRLARWLVVGLVGLASLLGLMRSKVSAAVEEAMISEQMHGALREAAIVPGARVWMGRPGTMLRARLETALDLYRARRVQVILVSGNEESGEASVMTSWLVDHGVPHSDILVDEEGFRTIGTMQRARDVFGVESAFICTQAVSMPRSLYLARAAGIDSIPANAAADPPHTASWVTRETAKSFLAVLETFGRTRNAPSSDRGVLAKTP